LADVSEVMDTTRTELRIEGMDCTGCLRTIEGRVGALDGVVTCAGSPATRILAVEYDPDRIEARAIRQEIQLLGYTALAPDSSSIVDSGTWRSRLARLTYLSGGLWSIGLAFEAWRVWPAPPIQAPAPAFATALFLLAALVGGWNFFPKAFGAARRRILDMNVLMTIAIIGAVAIGKHVEAASIAFLFSLAELLEQYAVDRGRDSIRALMRLAPATATVLHDGREEVVGADEVLVGEVVAVRPGERVPVDGTVERGASSVDQASITGEAIPVPVAEGSEVFAGTINQDGYLRVRSSRRAEDTTLARIVRLISSAEAARAPAERFVERFARNYTPLVVGGAVLVSAVPPLLFGAPFTVWFLRGLTLLVIACPCALVISTPVSVVSGLTSAARNGVLIKGGSYLEHMGQVEAIAFDKTGTLTHGIAEVTDVIATDGLHERELLRVAAAVEAGSEHPIARAVLRRARETGCAPEDGPPSEFEALPGLGARARLDGSVYTVGRPQLFDDSGMQLVVNEIEAAGRTAVLVARDRHVIGAIGVADRIRPQAAAVVRKLREQGVGRLVMLTGDSARAAEPIAAEVGVDSTLSDLLPAAKVDAVRSLEHQYGAVAMVGDGVNDAPALAASTVGIAMGAAGSDVALETADIALMGDDLGRLPYLYELSRRSRRVIRQNIAAAIGIKVVLAIGVPLGFVSLIAAVLIGDMGASLAVTANALRLAHLRPGG
jgi:Cd2+/Zn2+-exporting ATPase